jgi:hypothetical protein
MKTPFFKKIMNIPSTNGNGIYAGGLCAFSPFIFRLSGIGEVNSLKVLVLK